jgi:hemolysin III
MHYKENIEEIKIPEYTKEQERFNTISHVIGIPLAFVILFIGLYRLIIKAIDVTAFLGLLVFVITIIDVYFVSSLYHGTPTNTFNKKLFRVLDHCTIYLLIAGTYTPICVVLMNEHVVGLVMLLVEWGCAVIGIILNAFFFKCKAVQVISLILYLAMGWLVLFCGGFLYMNAISFGFVLAGGIVYSIGAILYAVGKKKNLYLHSVFHVFVLVSTIIQAIGVLAMYF